MQLSNQHYALIMAGGEGTRFAPLSTPEKPKQFLNLLNHKKTLLQQTYERLERLFLPENILVATNHRYIDLVRQQLPYITPSQIFGETHKKNTAPCLAWVSFQLLQKGKDGIVMAIPSDQFITPESRFQEVIAQTFQIVKTHNAIVTIGIKPTFASTHHGYVRKEGRHISGKISYFKAKEFVEKPDAAMAQKFFNDGNYYWNGGTFVFPVEKMVAAVQKHLPDVFNLLKKTTTIEEFFAKAPSISIDYGVMEKMEDLLVVEAPFTWSDVGTWESLEKLAKQHSLELPAEVKFQLQQR